MTYKELKTELEAKYGKAEFDMGKPLNESARQLQEYRIKTLADARATKKLKALEASSLPAPQLDVTPNTQMAGVPDSEASAKVLGRLSGFVPLESDLEAFRGIEKDLLRIYLANQHIEPKKLANSFGISYQRVAGLLNSKAVMMLRAKYFNKQLDNNTKIGLLKLTEEGDPRITLAAAEHLRILSQDKTEDIGSKIVDPKAEIALRLLADWLADSDDKDLVISRAMLVSG